MQKIEMKKSDFDGDITVGELKDQKRVGTIKIWKQARTITEHDKPAYAGYIIIDGEYQRLHLWETV